MESKPQQTVNEWDSPLRTRRLDYHTKQKIPDAEWQAWNWYNVTCRNDPQDAHVYIRTWKKGEPVI
jgi:hypothetical protein